MQAFRCETMLLTREPDAGNDKGCSFCLKRTNSWIDSESQEVSPARKGFNSSEMLPSVSLNTGLPFVVSFGDLRTVKTDPSDFTTKDWYSSAPRPSLTPRTSCSN